MPSIACPLALDAYASLTGPPLRVELLPAVLRRGGYRTHLIGKWCARTHKGHSAGTAQAR